jgi:hypothetical protein
LLARRVRSVRQEMDRLRRSFCGEAGRERKFVKIYRRQCVLLDLNADDSRNERLQANSAIAVAQSLLFAMHVLLPMGGKRLSILQRISSHGIPGEGYPSLRIGVEVTLHVAHGFLGAESADPSQV